MKKRIVSVFVAAVIFVLSGCAPHNGDEVSYANDPFDIVLLAPRLSVSIASETALPRYIQAIRGTTNWSVCDEYGMCSGFMSDSLHSLQLSRNDLYAVTLFLENGMNKIELQFSQSPLTVSVIRWNMQHWYAVKENHNNMGLAMNDYEIIEIIDNMMFYSCNDGQSYIYQVHATWQEGFSYFTFRTKAE